MKKQLIVVEDNNGKVKRYKEEEIGEFLNSSNFYYLCNKNIKSINFYNIEFNTDKYFRLKLNQRVLFSDCIFKADTLDIDNGNVLLANPVFLKDSFKINFNGVLNTFINEPVYAGKLDLSILNGDYLSFMDHNDYEENKLNLYVKEYRDVSIGGIKDVTKYDNVMIWSDSLKLEGKNNINANRIILKVNKLDLGKNLKVKANFIKGIVNLDNEISADKYDINTEYMCINGNLKFDYILSNKNISNKVLVRSRNEK